MDAQTSFIPKRTLDTQNRIERSNTVSIFTVLTTLIFFVSVAGAVALYLYHQKLSQDIQSLEAQIIENRSSFDERKIEQLANLDTRLKVSAQLLDSRLYTSKILELLNANTVSTVRFTKLTVEPSLVDRSFLKVSLSGQARDYASVALQSDIFSKIPQAITEYSFSNLTLDQAGNVLFDMSATVDRQAVRFDAPLGQAPAPVGVGGIAEGGDFLVEDQFTDEEGLLFEDEEIIE